MNTETEPQGIAVAGHICLDIIPTLMGDSISFLPGRLIDAGAATIATGGAVPNTGLALHRLGVPTRLLGKLGNDLFGKAVTDILEGTALGLADDMIVVPGEATSYSVILSPPGADRMFIHAPGCNATYAADDISDSALDQVRLMHFGYPPLMENMHRNNGDELVALFQRAKALGVTTSLDLAMPDPNGPAGQASWELILRRTLPFVDIFLPSIEELLLMLTPGIFHRLASGGDFIDQIPQELIVAIGQTLLEMGAGVVAIKCGHRGLYLRTADQTRLATMGRAIPTEIDVWANRQLWSPCFSVNVVGTTGSGDATIAGFLRAFLAGESPEDTITSACAVGASSVEGIDAVSGIPSWSVIQDRINRNWKRLEACPIGSDWQSSSQTGIWSGPLDR